MSDETKQPAKAPDTNGAPPVETTTAAPPPIGTPAVPETGTAAAPEAVVAVPPPTGTATEFAPTATAPPSGTSAPAPAAAPVAAPPVAAPPLADLDIIPTEEEEGANVVPGPIPEDDRVIPQAIETVTHDREGNPVPVEGVESQLYVQAHVNLPGWNLWAQVDGKDIPQGPSRGYIPNNEEGVHAVEIGFAELIDAPEARNR